MDTTRRGFLGGMLGAAAAAIAATRGSSAPSPVIEEIVDPELDAQIDEIAVPELDAQIDEIVDEQLDALVEAGGTQVLARVRGRWVPLAVNLQRISTVTPPELLDVTSSETADGRRRVLPVTATEGPVEVVGFVVPESFTIAQELLASRTTARFAIRFSEKRVEFDGVVVGSRLNLPAFEGSTIELRIQPARVVDLV